MSVQPVCDIWHPLSAMKQPLLEHWVISHILDVLSSLLIDSGKVTKRIFKDEQITDAMLHLKSSVDSYNNALGNINLRIVIKVYELLQGTY